MRKQLATLAPDWLQIVVVAETDRETFAAEMRDTDVLLHVLEPVTAEVIAAAPKLQFVQKIGVGVNTIDLDAALAHGVAVSNMPGTNSQAVAELTLTLMLAVLRRLVSLDRETRAGRGWSLPPDTFDHTGEIAGRVVGLVGYGQVARRLAPVLRALGADVRYTARRQPQDAAADWRPLDALLAEVDILSLHLPLAPETEKLLNRKALWRMKHGSVLINTARGGLVDEEALVDALRSGQLAAAGLDVLADEPARDENELLTLDNVVVTPHVAWLTPETLNRSIGIALENCARVRMGRPLLHQVVP
jgi:phosphoglycerate dehydrogenase-like enzyme